MSVNFFVRYKDLFPKNIMPQISYVSAISRFLIYILIFSTTADEFANGLFISVQDLLKQRIHLSRAAIAMLRVLVRKKSLKRSSKFTSDLA